MTGNRPEFDTILESWLDDGPTAAPSDLFEAAHGSIPQSHRQRRSFGAAWRSESMFSSTARALVSVAAVAVVAVAGYFLLRGLSPSDGVGGSPSPGPTDVAVTPTATPVGSPVATPAPTAGGVAACAADSLHAAVVRWEGAMGHRIGTVTLTYSGTAACTIPSLNQVQLLDKKGDVLLDSGPAAPSAALTLNAGDVVSTLVDAVNYCQAQPPAPITVGFVIGGATVVADPVGPNDTDGLPPCNGGPGSAGEMAMHPWQPGTNPA